MNNIPKVIDIRLPKNKQTFTMKEMYKFFKLVHPDSNISYFMYSEIISRYNKKAIMAKMFEGEKILLGSGIGTLGIKRVKRKFVKPSINWYETNKLKKEEGISKYVYYTDDYWYRFSWRQGTKLKNKSVYIFEPTKGVNGITKKFKKALDKDEFLAQKFIR